MTAHAAGRPSGGGPSAAPRPPPAPPQWDWALARPDDGQGQRGDAGPVLAQPGQSWPRGASSGRAGPRDVDVSHQIVIISHRRRPEYVNLIIFRPIYFENIAIYA